MLFNSIDFAVFLPVVFLFYWFVLHKSLSTQNLFVVISSYVFYGWWDWRFLSLIIFSTTVDYIVGRYLDKEERPKNRKLLLLTSILVNLGFLGFFKYYNFFVENFVASFSFFGTEINPGTLNIILPVGISFYTFQTLSYSIDVYKRKLSPTKDFMAFAAFVSFFPQLVAGPIERATNLLPQFQRKREFDYELAVDGARQILWGLVKKIVIADNCAIIANQIFNNSADYNGSTLLLGAIFFSFQIYGDFSGYSDIAIGTSRLFGFHLKRNFAYPYFARDIAEFWRRWHISLSTWFRDYLYIPLGGSKGGKFAMIRNTFIIFIVSGFWHGANWTFIIWGALNALYFLPLLLLGLNRRNLDIVAHGRLFPSLRESSGMVITFFLTVLAWIFFRAEDVSHAAFIYSGIFSESFLNIPTMLPNMKTVIILLIPFLAIEWLGREGKFALENLLNRWPSVLRWLFYYFLIAVLLVFGGKEQEFIYFQF